MRLICPNCGAQYEVPEGAVPETGRDVECSNCGHSWFERAGASPAGAVLPQAEEEPPAIEAPQPATPPEDEPEAVRAPAAEPPTERPRRRELDPHVASVLQAERDLAARRRAERESQSFESQPDLALEPAPQDRRARRLEPSRDYEEDEPETYSEPFAFLPAEPEQRETETADPEDAEPASKAESATAHDEEPRAPEQPTAETSELAPSAPEEREQTPAERAAAAEGFQRSERLPDIETVNTTLHPRHGSSSAKRWQVQSSAAEMREKRRRGGFRIGFLAVVLIALLLTVLYGQADRLAAAVPSAEPALQGYVETVNAGRLWLDLHLQDVLAQIETLAQD